MTQAPWIDLGDDPLVVAPQLLGAVISHAGVSVRLTEVEAYRGDQDPGSHAFRGRTARNEVMFGPAGRAYVYFTYGMHWCMNVVCWTDGHAGAVLLRAGEVIDGLAVAQERRPTARRERDLARGPANLAKALGLTGDHNGAPVQILDSGSPDDIVLTAGGPTEAEILSGPRVGVSGDGGSVDYPWRWWLAGEPTVSAYRPGVARGARVRRSRK